MILDNHTEGAYVGFVTVNETHLRGFEPAAGLNIMLNAALRNRAWVLCTKQHERRYTR